MKNKKTNENSDNANEAEEIPQNGEAVRTIINQILCDSNMCHES